MRDHLYSLGAKLVVRAAGSHTKADLVAFFPRLRNRSVVWIIQCKRDGKLSRRERAELMGISEQTGVPSYLAWKSDNGIQLDPLAEWDFEQEC